MWDEPDPDPYALKRQERDATRQRARNRMREDLLYAARTIIPTHGLNYPLANLAVYAGVPRHAARALFNTSAELATALVCRVLGTLIDRTAPAEGATPLEFVTGLIEALREETAVETMRLGLHCGFPDWQGRAIDDADLLLARALSFGLTTLCPEAAPTLGRRLLTLAREVAYAPERAAAGAEAVGILTLLVPGFVAASTAVPPAPAPLVVPPPVIAPAADLLSASLLSASLPLASLPPAVAAPVGLPAAAIPTAALRPRLHDPPAVAA